MGARGERLAGLAACGYLVGRGRGPAVRQGDGVVRRGWHHEQAHVRDPDRRPPRLRVPTTPARPATATPTALDGDGSVGQPGRVRRGLGPLHRHAGRGLDHPVRRRLLRRVRVRASSGPSNVLANNTPAGGDMGAHVWGPAYLRDHLLPSGRLSGWTPDWYAGFPAYTFYMIIPSLAIALLSYVIPYGIAFKLVAISGVLTAADRRLGLRPAHPPALPGAAAAGRGRHRLPVRPVVLDLRRQHRLDPGRRVRLLDLADLRRALPRRAGPRARDRQVPGLGRGAAGPHRAVPPDPALLRPGRHRRVVRPPARLGQGPALDVGAPGGARRSAAPPWLGDRLLPERSAQLADLRARPPWSSSAWWRVTGVVLGVIDLVAAPAQPLALHRARCSPVGGLLSRRSGSCPSTCATPT